MNGMQFISPNGKSLINADELWDTWVGNQTPQEFYDAAMEPYMFTHTRNETWNYLYEFMLRYLREIQTLGIDRSYHLPVVALQLTTYMRDRVRQ